MIDPNTNQSHIAKAMQHIQSAIGFGARNEGGTLDDGYSYKRKHTRWGDDYGTLDDGYSYKRKHTRWGDDDDVPVHGRTLVDGHSDKKKHRRRSDDESDPKHNQINMLAVVGKYGGEHVKVYIHGMDPTGNFQWEGEIHQTTNGHYELTLTKVRDNKNYALITQAGPYRFPLTVTKHTQSEFLATIEPPIKRKIPKSQGFQGTTIKAIRWDGNVRFLMKFGKRNIMFWKEKADWR